MKKIIALLLLIPILALSQTVQLKSDNVKITGGVITGTTGFLQNGTGAVTRTWGSKNQEIYNVKDFGVLCDGVTDDLANINAAIAAVNAAGGGILNFPAGTCTASATITNLPKVTLSGAGQNSTLILVSGISDGIKMISPTNASTDVFASIKNLQIKNTNGANVGAGYSDVGGHFIDFENVTISGFGFGIILDQSELVTIRRVYFDTQLTANLWLVNGADHTAGALGEFTNRITVQESNFSGHVICVADDGGINHSYENNNFEGCSNPFRLADQILFSATNNEFENSTASIFKTVGTSLTGLTLAGSTSIAIQNNQASIPLTFNFLETTAAVLRLNVSNNVLSNSLAASVALGSGLVGNFTQIGNYNAASSTYQSGTATTYLSLLGSFYRMKDVEIENQIVFEDGNARMVNGGGTDAITFTNPGGAGSIALSTNSVNRAVVSNTGIAVTGVMAASGAVTGATFNGNTISTGTGTLSFGAGKTINLSNSLTFTGTDGSSIAFGAGGTAAYVSNNLSAFAATTSAQLAGVLSDETGTGLAVFATSPTLITPIIGVATATSINKVAITQPATGATLTVVDGKTLTTNNTLTLAGTDGTTMTFPTTSATLARTDAANTFTGTQTVGALVATTVNGNTITTGTGTLTLATGKVATINNTLTLAGTDGTTLTFPTTNATIARTDAGNVFTGANSISTTLAVGGTTLNASPAAGFQYNGSAGKVMIRTNGQEMYFVGTSVGYLGTLDASSTFNLMAAGNPIASVTSSGIDVTGKTTSTTLETGSAALTLTTGALGFSKMSPSASAPGAGGGKLELVCGTNAGTAKLVVYAGTSSTAITIVDNIGTGVTGC